MMKNIALVLLFSCAFLLGKAQKPKDFDVMYNNAKALYQQGEYQKSFDLFKTLTISHKSNKYVEIAHYYVGLNAFSMQKYLDARYILQKLEQTYPDWKQLDEARYLRLNALLEEKMWVNAWEVLDAIQDKKLKKAADAMLEHYVLADNRLNVDSLQQRFPENQKLAALSLRKIMEKSVKTDADKLLAVYLVQDYDLDETLIDALRQVSVKKGEYNVALMLPLFLNNETGARKYYRFYEMLEGAKLAVEQLAEKGIKINLHVFDTEKSSEKATAFTKQEAFEGLDLIIGPIYPEPSAVIMDYAKRKGIVCVNPRLEDTELISGNEYGYLWLPSEANIVQNIYHYAKDSLPTGKVYILHTSSKKDVTFAEKYAALISQKDSMQVVKKLVDKDKIKEIAKLLYLGEPDEQNEDVLEKYRKKRAEMSHIVLATEENIVVAELMGVLEANNIKIPTFASHKALEINLISPDQFHRRNFIFYAPDYLPESKLADRFSERMVARLHLRPSSKYVHGYLGYDLLQVFGNQLHKEGTMVVNYDKRQIVHSGLLTNFVFSPDHTNAYVPLIKFNNQLKFNVLNPSFYE